MSKILGEFRMGGKQRTGSGWNKTSLRDCGEMTMTKGEGVFKTVSQPTGFTGPGRLNKGSYWSGVLAGYHV